MYFKLITYVRKAGKLLLSRTSFLSMNLHDISVQAVFIMQLELSEKGWNLDRRSMEELTTFFVAYNIMPK
jgi:hypothetical protein